MVPERVVHGSPNVWHQTLNLQPSTLILSESCPASLSASSTRAWGGLLKSKENLFCALPSLSRNPPGLRLLPLCYTSRSKPVNP